MKYKAVLFDLDGTLLDTIGDLADSMNTVLARFGFPVYSVEAYKYFVGDGVQDLALRVLPEARRDDDMVAKCITAYRQEYGTRWDKKTRPYEGIPDLLTALTERGVKMAVLSNKPEHFTKLTVAKLLPLWRFDAVVGERAPVPKKPDPAAALEIARLLAVPPREFLYVGDTNTDMKTANAAGMFAVGALWGFREVRELIANGAKVLVARPMDVLKLL
jgi:phosphoglycolate phosphatase